MLTTDNRSPSPTLRTTDRTFNDDEIDQALLDAAAVAPVSLESMCSGEVAEHVLLQQSTTDSSATTHQTSSTIIITPEENDVVSGRSKDAHSHPGNQFFRELIQNHREAYQRAQLRAHKRTVTNQVIEIVQKQRGGRFLKESDAIDSLDLEVMNEEQIYEKVSHALRAARAPKTKSKVAAKTNKKRSYRKATSSSSSSSSSQTTTNNAFAHNEIQQQQDEFQNVLGQQQAILHSMSSSFSSSSSSSGDEHQQLIPRVSDDFEPLQHEFDPSSIDLDIIEHILKL